jgi:hypothetical protein
LKAEEQMAETTLGDAKWRLERFLDEPQDREIFMRAIRTLIDAADNDEKRADRTQPMWRHLSNIKGLAFTKILAEDWLQERNYPLNLPETVKKIVSCLAYNGVKSTAPSAIEHKRRTETVGAEHVSFDMPVTKPFDTLISSPSLKVAEADLERSQWNTPKSFPMSIGTQPTMKAILGPVPISTVVPERSQLGHLLEEIFLWGPSPGVPIQVANIIMRVRVVVTDDSQLFKILAPLRIGIDFANAWAQAAHLRQFAIAEWPDQAFQTRLMKQLLGCGVALEMLANEATVPLMMRWLRFSNRLFAESDVDALVNGVIMRLNTAGATSVFNGKNLRGYMAGAELVPDDAALLTALSAHLLQQLKLRIKVATWSP